MDDQTVRTLIHAMVVVLVLLVLVAAQKWIATRGPRVRTWKPPKPPPVRPRPGPPPVPPPAPVRTIISPGQLDLASGGSVGTVVSAAPTPAPIQRYLAATPPRAAPKLELDPGQFAPSTDAQTKAAAQSAGNLWGNPWFGRRDLIPPASDPRTILIDRAMVGQGLLTAEELVEIHEVGDEMEKLRPELSGAHVVAERAVQEDREARARIKEQKKAEAAERKRQHAEDIARRRQTDIIYLGRGVSCGLADRRANVEKLTAAGLPVLATPADVASALQLSIPQLRWLAFHSEASPISHYIRFTVPKRSGGTRALFAPHRRLAATQVWILENILSKIPTHAAAHGFVPGRSTVTNAAGHVRRDVVLNTDLTDFFPTVTFPRVRGIFHGMGYSPAVATVLALLCTESPRRVVNYAGKLYHVATGPRGLPQGACTSPALSNLVARRLDSRLDGIARKLEWRYSRYADDLTFSASGEPTQKIGYLLARIRHITQDEGFAVNEKKTRVLRQSAAQNVTGIIVNQRPGVPRETVRRMRAILHRAKTEGLAAQNREKHPHFEMWVRGMIAYIEMVNPKQAEPLRRDLGECAK
ncbi:MAG TPA: reverse transcriptase domain-containing protein [Tepidisphaeraceae bacterium]|nr:reverse transcriptase domain-containing protein [Tepidisphaeraceae bacterium]